MTLAEAGESTWDALVLGAGPAGSMAALGLARAGAWTLLVERATFPRWKVCGACLNGHALEVLRSAGLGPRLGLGEDGKPSGSPCAPILLRTFELRACGRSCRVPLPESVALSRSLLDRTLAEAAREAGARVLFETQARVEGVGDGWREVRLNNDGVNQRVRARVVIDATGLGGAGRTDERARPARGSRIGAGCVVDEAPDVFQPGTIFMATGRRGYVGLVRVEDGSLNVAAAFDPAFLRSKGSPGLAAATILDETGSAPVPGLESAAWRGTPALTRRARTLAGERLFLVGDAAGYVEPFTGEGMAWALASARAVVPLTLHAIAAWDSRLIREWSTTHRRIVGRRQVLCRLASLALRTPWLLPALPAFGGSPGLAGSVVRRLNAPSPSPTS